MWNWDVMRAASLLPQPSPPVPVLQPTKLLQLLQGHHILPRHRAHGPHSLESGPHLWPSHLSTLHPSGLSSNGAFQEAFLGSQPRSDGLQNLGSLNGALSSPALTSDFS